MTGTDADADNGTARPQADEQGENPSRLTRVLYVIDSLAPGGAEVSLALVAPGLRKNNIDLCVLSLSRDQTLATELRQGGATVIDPPKRSGRMANVIHVVQAIRTYRPNLVHTTLFESDLAGRIASLLTRTPVSSSLVKVPGSRAAEGAPIWKLRLADTVNRWSGRRVGSWHAVTDTVAKVSASHLGVPFESIVVIPRGRDPEMYPVRSSAGREPMREALGISPTTQVLLAVARLEHVKGLDRLIAVADVMSDHTSTTVLIAGSDGREGPYLREMAQKSRADVRFLGHRSDISDLHSLSDLLCVPSRQEGICGALIEAMASGCPAVVQDLPTLHDVICRDKPVAWSVDFEETQRTARQIQGILDDEPGRRHMAKRARERFESEFTLAVSAARMADFFRSAAFKGREDVDELNH